MSPALSATQRAALSFLAARQNAEATHRELTQFLRLKLSIRRARLVLDRMRESGVISDHRDPERSELCLTLKGMRAMGWSVADVEALQKGAGS
jgi:predicted transcriptional regulator